MKLVTNWAVVEVDLGAVTRISARPAGGRKKWVTGMSVPGCVPSWELTGTASIPTNWNVCGVPLNSHATSRIVSDVQLQIRRNCVSPVNMCMMGDVKVVTPVVVLVMASSGT